MRVYKRGKTWYIDYLHRGQRIRRAVSRSRKVAELTAKDTELKIERGEKLGIYDQPEILFRDYAVEYLEYSKANKMLTSWGRDVTSLKWLTAAFGDDYLSDITPKDVEQYKRQRLQKGGVQPATVNREVACLKAMYNRAIEWDYVSDNPVRKVKMLKEPPPRNRFLERREIEALVEECSKHLKSIVVTALNTGMRLGEILHLQWSDVNLRSRTIMVGNSKNNEARFLPINEPLRDVLTRLSANRYGNFVFSNGKGIPYSKIHKGFRSACARAGIEDFRFHDLRHTFASHLVMAGVNLRAVQQLLGHKDIRMTMRYSHLSQQHLQEAVGLLSARLTG